MGFLAWSDDLATGIQDIDAQHRRIVDYINQLAVAKELGRADALVPVLERLVDYTASHFSLEEELMEKAGYACAGSHKGTHDLFVRSIQESQKRVAAGEDITGELLATLKTWLVYHIKHDDAAYAEDVRRHLASRDVQEPGWFTRLVGRFFKA
nr:bacteriohemerythrin [uncultured Holophaga sp.]